MKNVDFRGGTGVLTWLSRRPVVAAGRVGHSGLEMWRPRCHTSKVPRKIRELVADLETAGFVRVHGGKGSHRKFRHPKFRGFVLISGADGADAQHYQERQLRNALRQVQT
jgi:predicted RNA binding protein YcfA (HicA-like mRNA interferase family)